MFQLKTSESYQNFCQNEMTLASLFENDEFGQNLKMTLVSLRHFFEKVEIFKEIFLKLIILSTGQFFDFSCCCNNQLLAMLFR